MTLALVDSPPAPLGLILAAMVSLRLDFSLVYGSIAHCDADTLAETFDVLVFPLPARHANNNSPK